MASNINPVAIGRLDGRRSGPRSINGASINAPKAKPGTTS